MYNGSFSYTSGGKLKEYETLVSKYVWIDKSDIQKS